MIRGLKIDGKKNMSLTNEVVDVSSSSKIYVPLINQSVECTCLTKIGKRVKKGTIIGKREDLDFPILSPVSGNVIDIKPCLHSSGKMVQSVVIRNDKKEQLLRKVMIKDITKYSKEEFVKLLKDCSVTGMGGSDFPTFLKYKGDAKILIVNAVECEPYITADIMLAKLKADIILESINAIMKINNIEKCYIAYKEVNTIIKDSFIKYLDNYENIFLAALKDIYPMGWERNVVKGVLGIEYDKYPSEIGVIVNNISTIFSIYKALKFQRGTTKRIITISGEAFSEPVNVLIKNGTNMSSIIKKLGNYVGDNIKVIAGGPMMGNTLPSDGVIATNNLSAITILNDTDEELNNCISCGKCLKVCPAKLCPIMILKNIDDVEELKRLHPEKCVECGLCSYICPSKIGLRDAIKAAKKKVK